MSLSREAMLEVMAYADDELDAEAGARVEELLRTNEEARSVLDAMGTLGDVVREGVEDRGAESARSEGIADGVMAALAREPAGDAAKVVPITQVRRPRAGAMTATFVGLALAAGLILMLSRKTAAPVAIEAPLEPAPSYAPSQSSTAPPSEPGPAPAAVAQVTEPQGVDLEEAHSTKDKVNVFFVPAGGSGTTGAVASVVVWIDDRHGTN